ncbi:hypothetical protein [Arthrobacter sp. ISL-65]|uniref:hypothetical protein n=1 Tax=Arthrobacter sp. ISL-65 TaxID=2819112 RepID=UPI001BE9D348|nr:hypothetical protein [Arthrobacter sp. ISL-65]MBT2551347.1 hypothetical protein [Arthrobacter sp. ISL-65]
MYGQTAIAAIPTFGLAAFDGKVLVSSWARQRNKQRSRRSKPRFLGPQGSVDERSELGAADGDDVTVLLGEAEAFGVAVLGEGEQCSCEQGEPVGMLVAAVRRFDGLFEGAADAGQVA